MYNTYVRWSASTPNIDRWSAAHAVHTAHTYTYVQMCALHRRQAVIRLPIDRDGFASCRWWSRVLQLLASSISNSCWILLICRGGCSGGPPKKISDLPHHICEKIKKKRERNRSHNRMEGSRYHGVALASLLVTPPLGFCAGRQETNP